MPENYPIGFQIRAVSNLIKRKLYEIRPDGQPLLTDLQGRILGFLYHNQDREIFQRDIEEHFYIRRSTVSRLLAGMEEQGLLQRIPVPRDARLKKLVMTPRAVSRGDHPPAGRDRAPVGAGAEPAGAGGISAHSGKDQAQRLLAGPQGYRRGNPPEKEEFI